MYANLKLQNTLKTWSYVSMFDIAIRLISVANAAYFLLNHSNEWIWNFTVALFVLLRLNCQTF